MWKFMAVMLVGWVVYPGLIARPIEAATYYVSPRGDDKNPGTSPGRAWRTLRRSCDALRSGDTLMVGEGDYRQAPFFLRGAPGPGEDLSRSVVIRAVRAHTAVVHGDVSLTGFTKLPGRRSLYRCSFPRPVLSVVDSDTGIVYEKTESLDDADDVLASYCYDPDRQALIVHTVDGRPPGGHTLRAIVSHTAASYDPAEKRENPARTLILDGLVFKGFQSMALDLRYARRVTVRSCVFYHNAWGVYLANYARQCRILNSLFFSNNIRMAGSAENAPVVVNGDVGDILVDGNRSLYNRFNSIRHYGGTPTLPVIFSNNLSLGEAPFWFKPPGPGGKMIGNVSEGFTCATVSLHNTCASLAEAGDRMQSEDNLVFGTDPASREAARFADPIHGDYRLQSDSPFRGKGKGGSDPGAFPYKGDVFFVRVGGDDAAAGTSVASAWRTLSRSAARLRPGDTLYVLAGTYRDSLRLTQRATAAKPIRLRRRGRDRVVIEGSGRKNLGILLNGARHVRLEGFEIRGFTGAGIRADRCAAVRIEECLIHDNKGEGIRIASGQGMNLRNNTVARNGIGLVVRGTSALELINNILQDNRRAQLEIDAPSGNIYYGNYNCFQGMPLARVGGKVCRILKELRAALPERGGSISADARFAGRKDFRLQVGSPCRGRGHLERTIGRSEVMPVVPDGPEIRDVRVHYVGGTNATITFATPRKPCYSLVRYGADGEPPLTVAVELDRRIFHVVNLTGLKPNTRYWFQAGARYPQESWVEFTCHAWGQAEGPPAEATAFARRQTLRTLAADPPGRMLYVRADGSDASDGRAPATAWRTIRRAALEAHAGDTVIVGPGRYHETIAPYNSGVSETLRITFRAETPRAAVLDGKGFSLPFAVKLISKRYVTVDGFRVEYFSSNAYGMSGINPWSALVLFSQSRFCVLRNCYLNGGCEFPRADWTAEMGVRLDDAEGAVVEDNFFVLLTWSVWTTTARRPGPDDVPPLLKNNTFLMQHIWAILIAGANDTLKLRNNLFMEYVRSKWDHQYFWVWHPAARLDSDYNFFWWHNDKQSHPEACLVGVWEGGHNARLNSGGGLAPWREVTGQDRHSLEGYLPTNNLYDHLDFTLAGKPYQGKGENGADIGCTWIGRHTDRIVFEPDSVVDIPPWRK